MAFSLQLQIPKQAIDAESGALFEGLTASRENVYAFRLHWQGKDVIINARRKHPSDDIDAVGDEEDKRARWVIMMAGCAHPYYPNRHLIRTRAEYSKIIELAVEALKVIPPFLNGPAPTSVELSNPVKQALIEFLPVV